MAAIAIAAGVATAACAEIGTGLQEPAAIELPPFPSPSVVIGDTLRDVAGKVASIRAIVRNVRGDIIADAPVRFLYADNPRDSAIAVDSASGLVRALRVAKGDARIAARVGGSLQVLRALVVTTRPDSIDGSATTSLFTTTLPDTGRTRATTNTSPALGATVRHIENATTVAGVNAWPVQFTIIRPANPTNDTTAAVFLVDDTGRPSTRDTTDASGLASRRVRVRAALFPTGTAVDSVIVQATASYRGSQLKGAPVRIALPVRRGS